VWRVCGTNHCSACLHNHPTHFVEILFIFLFFLFFSLFLLFSFFFFFSFFFSLHFFFFIRE